MSLGIAYCEAEILFNDTLRHAYVTYFEPVSIVEPLIVRIAADSLGAAGAFLARRSRDA